MGRNKKVPFDSRVWGEAAWAPLSGGTADPVATNGLPTDDPRERGSHSNQNHQQTELNTRSVSRARAPAVQSPTTVNTHENMTAQTRQRIASAGNRARSSRNPTHTRRTRAAVEVEDESDEAPPSQRVYRRGTASQWRAWLAEERERNQRLIAQTEALNNRGKRPRPNNADESSTVEPKAKRRRDDPDDSEGDGKTINQTQSLAKGSSILHRENKRQHVCPENGSSVQQSKDAEAKLDNLSQEGSSALIAKSRSGPPKEKTAARIRLRLSCPKKPLGEGQRSGVENGRQQIADDKASEKSSNERPEGPAEPPAVNLKRKRTQESDYPKRIDKKAKLPEKSIQTRRNGLPRSKKPAEEDGQDADDGAPTAKRTVGTKEAKAVPQSTDRAALNTGIDRSSAVRGNPDNSKLLVKVRVDDDESRDFLYHKTVDWDDHKSIQQLNRWRQQVLRREVGKVREPFILFAQEEMDWLKDALAGSGPGPVNWTETTAAFNAEFAGKVLPSAPEVKRPSRGEASLMSLRSRLASNDAKKTKTKK
ncbi:MAG: hypothetical protein M1825_000399 [Sarcosagium campestre]|nr:MAG: hypothetical protein M1825_000399 [Sarcosagium campestre]